MSELIAPKTVIVRKAKPGQKTFTMKGKSLMDFITMLKNNRDSSTQDSTVVKPVKKKMTGKLPNFDVKFKPEDDEE